MGSGLAGEARAPERPSSDEPFSSQMAPGVRPAEALTPTLSRKRSEGGDRVAGGLRGSLLSGSSNLLAKARRRRAARAVLALGGAIRAGLANRRLADRTADAATTAVIGLAAGRPRTIRRRHRPLDRGGATQRLAAPGSGDNHGGQRNFDLSLHLTPPQHPRGSLPHPSRRS